MATPPTDSNDKTAVRLKRPTDDTLKGRQGAASPARRGGLRADQVRYLVVAWIALTVIAGVCAFVGIYAFTNGEGVKFTDATPLAQVPTATSTPFPTFAPFPTPVPPTQSPDTGGGGVAQPTLPPIQAFNLGGQAVHGGFPHAEQMTKAGMTWAKLQAYDLTVDFGPAIVNAHNLGFRILVSVKDEANKQQVTSPAYQQQFAAYLVTLAQQGADAIEVWNESNIDREWPTGQISGQAYTQLLQLVYPQIKAANPNTMVISGALSPTGFFGGGCSPQGCDDKPFLEAMVAADAMNYADCVGIHYNEGILPPSATSGDPRGNPNHYTRYYQTMVNTYLTATGGQKPLCFTELGYLAGGEYPNLGQTAPGFAWAAKTTLAQQAQWLAEAADMAKASNGQVRLLIVFNVDLETGGADPQSGYAIIRPDGSCPACDTLAVVMSK
ncbi:MAG: hypothetical protein HY023_06690 [Chloroflexi bacterium]|nr:hypothetical protein [Chloroflexota bacterium]